MSLRGIAELLLCGIPYLFKTLNFYDMQATTTKSRTVGKFVDSKHTDKVIRNYKQERWVQNSKHIGKEDSLSAWYSVEELERFLSIIKEHGADGVRMYFGAYDADYSEVPLYAGRQTIVMVATQGKETEKGIVDKDIYIAKEDKNSILAYNAAKLCPPLCKPNEFDQDWGGIGVTLVDLNGDGMAIL
jgi:hypothetical protein